MIPLRLEAPAKLNLTLTVLGRREDGHHLLDSTFVLLELSDRLLLMPGCSGLRVEGSVGDVPLDGGNLAVRGLRLGMGGGDELACLALEKRIPVAAGLGGGSSDAAAAWRLGRRWRGLPDTPGEEELLELSQIGADVPFFAAGLAAARVRGIGEQIEPADAEWRRVVLVHPPFGLSTRAVFSELRPDEWGRLENDLLAPARRLRPELDDLFGLVIAAGGEPRLTGSGSTIYALTEDPERASAVAGRLRRAGLPVTLTGTRLAAPSIESIEEDEE